MYAIIRIAKLQFDLIYGINIPTFKINYSFVYSKKTKMDIKPK